MGKLIGGIVLATVAMFVFSAIFWMSPLVNMAANETPTDGSVQQALLETFPDSGTYFIPGGDPDDERVQELHRQGPLALVHVTREGKEVMDSSVFIAGFLHQLAIVAVLAGLMVVARPSLISYARRMKFVVVAGVLVALFPMADIVWWYTPPPFPLLTALFNYFAVVVAGLVLAAFIKPAVETA